MLLRQVGPYNVRCDLRSTEHNDTSLRPATGGANPAQMSCSLKHHHTSSYKLYISHENASWALWALLGKTRCRDIFWQFLLAEHFRQILYDGCPPPRNVFPSSPLSLLIRASFSVSKWRRLSLLFYLQTTYPQTSKAIYRRITYPIRPDSCSFSFCILNSAVFVLTAGG